MVFVSKFLTNIFYLLGGYVNYSNDYPGPKVDTVNPPSIIPREILLGNPEKTSIQLNPDGKFLAFLAPLDGVLNIHIQPLQDALRGISSEKPITFDKGRGISGYSWTHLPGILLYVQDKDGDENYRLYKIDVKTGNSELLTDTDGVKVSFVASHEDFPDTLYIGLNNRDPRFHDLYQLNISTGNKELFLLNTEGYSGFLFDQSLTLRLASKEASDGGINYFKATGGSGNATVWELYRHVPFRDSHTTGPAGFDPTNRKLYWQDSTNRDKAAFILTDFENQSDHIVIYEPKKSDVGAVLFHPLDDVPLAVYEDYRRPELIILNDTVKQDFQYLNSLSGNGEPYISGTSEDFTKWLVVISSDNQPSQYYFYDREAKRAQYLFVTTKAIAKYKLTKMHTAEIATRDGLTQVCYLTLPLENDPLGTGHPLVPGPMILNVHGGPWARDSWGLDGEIQLLANRGYAVLQCNFRSSTGFGKSFINAGNGEWAGKMHDDLIDAVDWAVRNRIADPDRVAIYGGSYGGYAALVGLTFTPEVFACGVDIVGPSNLISLIHAIPPYWQVARKSMIQQIGGDPDTAEGRAFLKSRSPLFFAHRIRKPLLIAQGANDPRVNKNESDQIFHAMRRNKIPVTYLLFADEGHGFVRPENRIAYITETEKFLANCLGGRFQPQGNDSDTSSMRIVHEGNFS